MHSIIHLAIGIIAAYYLNLSPEWFVIFSIASIAIDLDHFLEFKGSHLRKEELLDPVTYSKGTNYANLQKSLHFFHTFEVLLIIFLLSLNSYFFWIIFLSFALHMLLDILGDIWNRNLFHHGEEGWLKYWFLTYYVYKRDFYNRENII